MEAYGYVWGLLRHMILYPNLSFGKKILLNFYRKISWKACLKEDAEGF